MQVSFIFFSITIIFFRDVCLIGFVWLFTGVTGATIKIDKFGDSEGNFSVLALKEFKLSTTNTSNFTCDYHMVPVAYFQQGVAFPVSESSYFVICFTKFFYF